MLNTLTRLLGDNAPILRRYLLMTVLYGVFSGLTISSVAPVMSHLLGGDIRGASAWLAALAVGMALCWAWRRRVEQAGVAVAVAVLRSGRQQIGAHMARLPLGWFSADNSARLSHVISQGTMAVAQLPAHVLTPLISGAIAPLVLVPALFALHGPLGLIALLALPLLVAVMLCSARLGHQAERTFHQHFAETSQRMLEFAQAQSVLRAFNGTGGGTRLLEQSLQRQHGSAKGLIARATLAALLNSWAVQATFAALLLAAGLWLGSQVGGQPQEVLAVVAALLLVCRFIDPLQDVASHVEILRGAQGQLREIERILSTEPLPEPASPQRPMDGSIDLQGVSLRYSADGPDVLRKVDLHVPAGSMVAIIGASGSGKTSLLRLIARFFDASEGSVRIGHVDVRQIARATLTDTLSQVLQDTWLFQGDIAANIRIGKPDAGAHEVLQAARLAGLTEVLQRLPQGLATPVGEGGARLSGGERQRVSIARALVRQAPILLVDEATAALDAQNQALISETLRNLRGRCTLVVSAHQLGTISMADHVVVLEAGQVVEQGSPEALRASGGRYAHLLEQSRAANGWRSTAAQVEPD
ncbi:ABC transporter ATP-binding protein/permease [Pseudomonas sp. GD03858]|uniref:ABC transporter ATP-binding protein n=1 Tax=unclassified Pseudomonas TaxID=196821 RepID=UPI002449100F|nr:MULTISPECIES: ABC transporter ATP-binding protein [unclassified Pseudomonas]MDH0645384.1 ABC transporter ATP-binding protein/permease [Pseudomonas sp. GD03867]MDH0663948.1 ABC transporter ATP-binding protein/permease [Pseudomonas sp. GD03858]